jgi:hypothetical protein
VDVARGKAFADRVTWIVGDATALAGRCVGADLAVMTGNVAQVFVDDEDWIATLDSVRESLRPGGWFAFETRRLEARDWEHWDVPATQVQLPDGMPMVVFRTVTEVDLPLVTFESTATIGSDTVLSTSTLRFRSRQEVESDLLANGFVVTDVREAPDRPAQEMVFLARRRD